MKNQTISDEVLDVLKQSTIEGNSLKLNGQLDRKLYLNVNKVLELAGGKWDKKSKTHIFESDPKIILGLAIEEGEILDKKQSYQVFYTPKDIAKRMVEIANIKTGTKVLEPSAGEGNIADAAKEAGAIVICCEIQQESVDKLTSKGYLTISGDFLDLPQIIEPFDAILMNPPFTKNQDIDHVLKAYSFLKEGGTLVSVMSPGFTFGTQKKRKSFKEFVEKNGYWEKLPEDSFKESGTGVNTVLVVLNKNA